MSKPVVTIGIPMYNAEKTIGLCLKSILNSDYDMSKVEIIIIDNFSKDNSIKVAKTILSLSNVNYIILSYKGSVGFLRQIIVNNANGKYIIWIDSDAIISKDFIRRQVEFAEKDVKLGAVLPIILPYNVENPLARGIGYMWSLSTVRALLKKKTPFLGILGALTPVKTIREVGGFNIKLQSGEDIDLFYRMQKLRYKIYVNPYAEIYHIMPTKLSQIVTRAYRLSYYYHQSKNFYLIFQNTFDFIAAILRMFYCFKKFNDYACATLPLISVIEGIAKYLATYFK